VWDRGARLGDRINSTSMIARSRTRFQQSEDALRELTPRDFDREQLAGVHFQSHDERRVANGWKASSGSSMDIRSLGVLVKTVQWSAVALLLSAAGVLADVGPGWAQQAPGAAASKPLAPTESVHKAPPRITPSTKTTKVVAPFDEDGYVDYVAALNEMYGRNVTPENNAGLLFVRASRIEGFGPTERKRFFELLHCPPLLEEGNYLTDIDQYVQKRMGRPATKQETDTRDRARRYLEPSFPAPLPAKRIGR
jgi:hypothetical protein